MTNTRQDEIDDRAMGKVTVLYWDKSKDLAAEVCLPGIIFSFHTNSPFCFLHACNVCHIALLFAHLFDVIAFGGGGGQLAKLRVPVVVRGTAVDLWAARSLWTPSYLASQMATLKNARNGTHPRFIGVSTKPGLLDSSLLHDPLEPGRNYQIQNIHIKDFLKLNVRERERERESASFLLLCCCC